RRAGGFASDPPAGDAGGLRRGLASGTGAGVRYRSARSACLAAPRTPPPRRRHRDAPRHDFGEPLPVNDEQDNVIHLAFRGDGTVERIMPPKAPPAEPDAPGSSHAARDPLVDLYSRREVARLFGLTEGRLRYWERTEFLSPSASE